MRRLLERQLRRAFPHGVPQEAQLNLFIDLVQQAYDSFTEQAQITERSLDLSSEELTQRNNTLESILDSLPDISLWIDSSGKVKDIRKGSFTPSLVSSADNYKQLNELDLVVSSPQLQKFLANFQNHSHRHQDLELHLNNQSFHVHATLVRTNHQRWLLVLQDISLRKKLEELQQLRLREVERSQLQLQALVNSAPIGIMICRTNFDVMMINNFLPQLLGMSQEKLLSTHPKELVSEPDQTTFINAANKSFSDCKSNRVRRCDIAMLFQGTVEKQVEVCFSTILFDNRKMLIMSITDISERKTLEQKLRYLAETDPLTGALNRRSYYQQNAKAILNCKLNQHSFSLILLDIDLFKSINDTFGHPVGDDVLTQLSQTILSKLKPDFLFGRMGGEEFAISCPNTNLTQAIAYAEFIRQSIEQIDLRADGTKIPLSASLGVAEAEQCTPEYFDKLYKVTDECVYRAKHSGRNKVFSTQNMKKNF